MAELNSTESKSDLPPKDVAATFVHSKPGYGVSVGVAVSVLVAVTVLVRVIVGDTMGVTVDVIVRVLVMVGCVSCGLLHAANESTPAVIAGIKTRIAANFFMLNLPDNCISYNIPYFLHFSSADHAVK
jgi:hypothetical protein